MGIFFFSFVVVVLELIIDPSTAIFLGGCNIREKKTNAVAKRKWSSGKIINKKNEKRILQGGWRRRACHDAAKKHVWEQIVIKFSVNATGSSCARARARLLTYAEAALIMRGGRRVIKTLSQRGRLGEK